MKYSVTHSCGHQTTEALFGSYKDRESKLAWLKESLCTECYREEQAAQAKAAAEKAGLPALVGSEKQVAWAAKERAESLKRWDLSLTEWAAEIEQRRVNGLSERELASAAERGIADPLGVATASLEKARALLEQIKSEPAARWWIDHRGASLNTILATTK